MLKGHLCDNFALADMGDWIVYVATIEILVARNCASFPTLLRHTHLIRVILLISTYLLKYKPYILTTLCLDESVPLKISCPR